MDGWNTTFLLGRPIFRGELLVSGRVFSAISKGPISPHLFHWFSGAETLAGFRGPRGNRDLWNMLVQLPGCENQWILRRLVFVGRLDLYLANYSDLTRPGPPIGGLVREISYFSEIWVGEILSHYNLPRYILLETDISPPSRHF